MARLRLLALGMLVLMGTAAAERQDDYADDRALMVETVENLVATIGVDGRRRLSPAVLDAMRQVPRHLLLPKAVQAEAYRDYPVPIGHGQTMSQPFIVAVMTELVRPEKDDIVLEVGTGSGYQAAVLSRLVDHVYSIEIVPPLAKQAAERLAALGYGNVTVRQGDGYAGWPEHAPFDGIIVTAGADHVPAPLIAQLKAGGRMVIPVGPTRATQELLLIEKDRNGRVTKRPVLPVTFVPLTGERERERKR